MARPTSGPQGPGLAGPQPAYQGYHHGAVGDGRASYGVNNNNDHNGQQTFNCAGPPAQTFAEFLSQHGMPRPQQSRIPAPVQHQQPVQQPEPANMYPGTMWYPGMRHIVVPPVPNQADNGGYSSSQ